MIFKEDINDKLLKPILQKINLFVKYSAGILIGCSVIGLGKVLPQDSIKGELSQQTPITKQLQQQSKTIRSLQNLIYQITDHGTFKKPLNQSKKHQLPKFPLQLSVVATTYASQGFQKSPSIKVGFTWRPLQEILEQDMIQKSLNSWTTLSLGMNVPRLVIGNCKALKVPLPDIQPQYTSIGQWEFGINDIQGPRRLITPRQNVPIKFNSIKEYRQKLDNQERKLHGDISRNFKSMNEAGHAHYNFLENKLKKFIKLDIETASNISDSEINIDTIDRNNLSECNKDLLNSIIEGRKNIEQQEKEQQEILNAFKKKNSQQLVKYEGATIKDLIIVASQSAYAKVSCCYGLFNLRIKL